MEGIKEDKFMNKIFKLISGSAHPLFPAKA